MVSLSSPCWELAAQLLRVSSALFPLGHLFPTKEVAFFSLASRKETFSFHSVPSASSFHICAHQCQSCVTLARDGPGCEVPHLE